MRTDGRRLCKKLNQLDPLALPHVAAYFQALSEPLRLRILNELRSGPRNVNELTARLDCSQANVSKHLGVLARLGFVARHARGTAAYYRIADEVVYDLCDLVCDRIALRLQHHVETLRAFRPKAERPARAAARKPGKTARRTAEDDLP